MQCQDEAKVAISKHCISQKGCFRIRYHRMQLNNKSQKLKFVAWSWSTQNGCFRIRRSNVWKVAVKRWLERFQI